MAQTEGAAPSSPTEERPSERRRRDKPERDRHHDTSRPTKVRERKPKVYDAITGERIRSHKKSSRVSESGPVEHGSSMSGGLSTGALSGGMADLVPELARTSSAEGTSSRSSIPYPTFSKAHSKESTSRDDVSATTPPASSPTPLASKTDKYNPTKSPNTSTTREPSAQNTKTDDVVVDDVGQDERPRSPPDTEPPHHAKNSPGRTSRVREDATNSHRTPSSGSLKSWFGRTKVETADTSRVSYRSKSSKASTAKAIPSKKSLATPKGEQSNVSSIPSEPAPMPVGTPRPHSTEPRTNAPSLDADDSPSSNHDSSPRTPTADSGFSTRPFAKTNPSPFSYMDTLRSRAMHSSASPMPPIPPPSPEVPTELPRVDYLLQNGGLLRPVPRTLMAVTPAYGGQPFPASQTPAPPEIEKVFGPFYSLLDQYSTVIDKHGSMAVATGYRSVARRLLDRLENVFARELPETGCVCVMCMQNDNADLKPPGWGDVLEAVSRRRDIPAWPPMDSATLTGHGLGLGMDDPPRPDSPVKIDPDIAEEFPQHYLHQSAKTKASVNKWLNATPGEASSPPPDVDDETLTFTILTHLTSEERPLMNALIAGSDTPVESMARAPTPEGKPRAALIVRAALSLQRLYNLPIQPRDPEICVYLLRNPEMHNLIVSLSEINNAEWEILISGRFDGFLWSGADCGTSGSTYTSPTVSRGPTPANGNSPRWQQALPTRTAMSLARGLQSRMTTTTNFGRSTTPHTRSYTPTTSISSLASTGTYRAQNAISNDEETEIATLAELEREIYVGMEALEDAFEGLHRKAEAVRRALRQRGAGLSVMAQRRRIGSSAALGEGMHARLDTPGLVGGGVSGGGGGLGHDGFGVGDDGRSVIEVDDWEGESVFSDLIPDDSASNISSSRHRRPKRRVERRTPAAVEEE